MSQWIELLDDKTNRKFYANTETNARTWTMPEEYRLLHNLERPVEPKWWELYDENNKLPYYHNIETGETLWVKPEGVEILTLSQQKSNTDGPPSDAAPAAAGGGAVEKTKKERPKKSTSTSAVATAAATAGTTTTTPASVEKKKSLKKEKLSKSASLKKSKKSTSANEGESTTTTKESVPVLKPGWIAVLDEQSGQYYYHNAELNETTWSRERAEDTSAAAAAAVSKAPPPPPPAAAAAQVAAASSTSTSTTTATATATTNESRNSFEEPRRSSTGARSTTNSTTSSSNTINNTNNDDDGSDSESSSSGDAAATTTTTTNDDSNSAVATEIIDAGDGVSRQYTSTGSLPRTRAALPVGEREKALPTSIAEELSQFQLEEFAKKFFDSHKKGVFRRQVPIKELLMWSANPIKSPLIRIANQNAGKEAVAMFKNIMIYMGDQPIPAKGATKTPIHFATLIVTKACELPEIRDEIYCQLCKQTTGNPNMQNNIKGWELFVMCAYSFPPTKDFEGWLRHYISNHRNSGNDTIQLFASYTLRLLTRITRLFGSMLGKIPTQKELQTQREAPFSPSPFGATLEECMELQRKQHPDAQLPVLMTVLCDAVLSKGGQKAEGLFRVAADMNKSAKLRTALESNINEVPENDPHVIGAVLKVWIRELAEPMIPDAAYDDCVRASDNPKKCVKVVQTKLSPLHQKCLLYLMDFLRRIAEFSEVTKMGIPNLAMVFAPNIMRCPATNPQTIFENSRHEVNFISHLLKLYKS